MQRDIETKLSLIAGECGASSLGLVQRADHAAVYKGVFDREPHRGEPCVLKILRGSHEFLVAHDELVERLMTAQSVHIQEGREFDRSERRDAWSGPARAMVPRAANGCELAARFGIQHIVRHGYMAFPDGDETAFLLAPWMEGFALSEYLTPAEGQRYPSFGKDLQLVASIAASALNLSDLVPGAMVLHRDLRPSNIIVTPPCEDAEPAGEGRPAGRASDKEYAATIIDFDTACIASRAGKMLFGAPVVGTPGYAAPEEFSPHPEEDLNARMDVYSLGVIAHEVLTGSWPYTTDDARRVDCWRALYKDGRDRHVMIPRVDSGRAEHPWVMPYSISPQLPEDVARLIAFCMSEDPLDRPGLSEAAESFSALARRYADERGSLRERLARSAARETPTPVSLGGDIRDASKAMVEVHRGGFSKNGILAFESGAWLCPGRA